MLLLTEYIRILEIQTFLVELIRNFEFTLAVDHSLIRREASMAMAPTIAGEVEKGCQLPFIITSLARND